MSKGLGITLNKQTLFVHIIIIIAARAMAEK